MVGWCRATAPCPCVEEKAGSKLRITEILEVVSVDLLASYEVRRL
jgi:hypothetical protein